jgi:hypothetical protein
MSFSSLGKFLPRITHPKLAKSAATALALEAGTAWIRKTDAALAERTRLVSIRSGVVHAFASSAPAKAELLSCKDSLFKAMESPMPIKLTDLRVEIRGTLADELSL